MDIEILFKMLNDYADMEDISLISSIPPLMVAYLIFFFILFFFGIFFMFYRVMQYFQYRNENIERIVHDEERPPLPPPPHTK